jgi:hypothetical protein
MTTVVFTMVTMPGKANDDGVTTVADASSLQYSGRDPLSLQLSEGVLVVGYIPQSRTALRESYASPN